jgi:uncharacterized double-CXXCG motif protein
VRLFHVHRDHSESAGAFSYEIIAAHTWTLPGVQDCPKCYETWASSVAYPDVDLTAMPGEDRYRVRRPQTLYVVHRMREAVRPFVAPGATLPPGTEFGPLIGHGKGSFGDFGWPQWPGVMLVRPKAAAQLVAAGIRGLRTLPARITYWGGEDPLFSEVALTFEGRIADDALPAGGAQPCAACGHRALPSGKRMPVDSDSLTSTVDIFRGKDMPSCIYATEAFVDAARALGLTDIAFEEIAVRRSRAGHRVSYRL